MDRRFIVGVAAFAVAAIAISALGPVQAQAVQAQARKKSGLIGTAWSGRETLAGFGSLTFEFDEGNNVTMIDAQDTVPGRYSRNGAAISISVYNGQTVYFGRISGKTMSGKAKGPRGVWTWSVTLEEDLPTPDAEPKPDTPEKKPADPVDAEKKAAELLQQAKRAIQNNNPTLARVRCRYIVTEYPQTKAAIEARKLLEKLAK